MAAPIILPHHVIDEPSSGGFKVKVVQRKRSKLNGFAYIQVQYNQWIGPDYSFHVASFPWSGGGGGDVSVEQVEQLLTCAQVPAFIRSGSATNMILRCVNEALMEAKMRGGSRRLPSIVARIVFDDEAIDSAVSDFETDDDVDDQ